MKHADKERNVYMIWRFATMFFLIAFVITVSFLLFFHSAQVSWDAVEQNGWYVIGNILFLSLLFCLVEALLRKVTTGRVVRRIREATSRMAAGDLSARIDTEKMPAVSRDYNQIARDFNKMAEELASTETLQTDFISNVSHEMKTPLSVVRNYATLLSQPNLTEAERKEYTQGIIRGVERTTTLMSNILRMNKLENQQSAIQTQIYDVGEQLAECLVVFSEIWEDKGIEIEADIDEGLFIESDPELMSVVWNNLISNAIKFTERGGTVTVSAHAQGESVEVSVRDTGCGMSDKTGRHIFDKFYQGDTSHATEGNGLGLAMVRRIIDMTGSEISVESELGKGSTFTVRLRSAAHEDRKDN